MGLDQRQTGTTTGLIQECDQSSYRQLVDWLAQMCGQNHLELTRKQRLAPLIILNNSLSTVDSILFCLFL